MTKVLEQPLDAMDVIGIVREHLGTKITKRWIDAKGRVRFVIYDAFSLRITPDDYGGGGSWGMGVILDESTSISSLLGRKLILLERREQFEAALDVVDRYARLRLGAEYLEAFEATRRPASS